LTVHNSIIAGNLDNGTAPDFVPPDNPAVNLVVLSSLIGVNTGTTLSESQTANPSTGNLVGSPTAPIDPVLGFLDVSGGSTGTHILLPGSPAIDAGNPLLAVGPGPDGIPKNSDDEALTTDQRGGPFARVSGASIDMGAYERQTLDPALFVITTTADTSDYSDGEVSLREAINSANGGVGDDTLTFGGPVFSDSTADTIALELGQLSITGSDSLTIISPGFRMVSIDAQQRSRVMYFNDYGDLTLRNLTITGGQTTANNLEGDGAGIRFLSAGKLTIEESEISGNTILADFSNGGGIYSYGNVETTGSVVGDNRATMSGGGLYANGTVTSHNSIFHGNSAGSHGGGIWAGQDVSLDKSFVSANTADGHGGGIIQSSGTMTIWESEVFRNTAAGDGGGIHVAGDLQVVSSVLSGNYAMEDGGAAYVPDNGDLTVINSTVSGNTADARGGGLFFDNGEATILSSTIANNQASGAGGGIGNLNDGFGESLTIHNSIVAGNSDNGTAPSFVSPAPTTRLEVLFSLIDDNTGTTLGESQSQDPVTGNLIGDPLAGGKIDPLIGPLRGNGGSGSTHAPSPASPALDAGSAALLPPDVYDLDGDGDTTEPLPRDQRGCFGCHRIQGPSLDIGAFESEGFDFGDAPDPYPTRLPDGASHVATRYGPRLGASRDAEPDGQPTPNADGDGSDDDGVLFGGIYSSQSVAAVNVSMELANAAYVDAWIDFDRNGMWEASEKILDSVELINQLQTLNYDLPSGLIRGDTYARVRISLGGGLGPTGPAADGEVEDYRVTIDPPPQIESVEINGADDQRSSIDRVTVNFDRIVEIDQTGGDPFQIVNTDTNDTVIDVPVISEVNGKTVVELSFQPGASVTSFGSLVDGNYRLTIDAALITRFGIALDGDGDGSAGGNHIFGDQAVDEFYRRYGDHNGNGIVELFDFAAFRSTFGKSAVDPQFVIAFDSNGDAIIDLFDFAAFRANFGS
jgi:CSLREA domain-containing protein